MEYEKIKQLIDDIGNSKLTEVDIEFPDGMKISMKKEFKADKIIVNQAQDNHTNVENTIITEKMNEEKIELKGNIVKSPMVGTFYMKPSPTSEAFVEVGKNVKKGETLCIIEAMKLMNEIESEFTGKVLEVLVEDGSVVEYGTPLFRIGE